MRSHHVPLLAAALALGAPALANHGPGTSGGGSVTPTGETLKRGRWEVALRSEFTDYHGVSRERAEQIAAQQGDFDGLRQSFVQTIGLAYGLTDDLQIGAQSGWYWGRDSVAAEADGAGGAASAGANPSGATDTWIQAKYRVSHGPAGHVALMAGVKLPTGDHSERLSDGTQIEPSGQPGTGALDGQVGIGYSRYLTGRWTVDAGALYTFRERNEGFRVGERLDTAVAYAWRATEDVTAFPNWSFSAELLGVWLDKDNDSDIEIDASGGATFYAAPGLRCRVSEGFALGLAVPVPISQDLNGAQAEVRLKGSFYVTLSF